MLDLLGKGYILETCAASYRQQTIEEGYRIYITDCVRALAICLGAKSSKRWVEILHPPKVDERSAAEIVTDITARAGLRMVS